MSTSTASNSATDEKCTQPKSYSSSKSQPSIAEPSLSSTSNPAGNSSPTVVLVIGMAGSGKTAFMNCLSNTLRDQNKSVYLVNLDPAVHSVPYSPNIDIRDTVKYKEVMKQFQLGPNGAIITSLNLFATRFDQVLTIIEDRVVSGIDYVLVDTPGQIEVFNWSASGTIIMDSFAVTFPTVCVFIMDAIRCASPTTFMSNMLYATSIMFKSKLPLVGVFNKADACKSLECETWMNDFDKYLESLSQRDSEQAGGYMNSLMRSMAINMSSFYEALPRVFVSSLIGSGFDGLCKLLTESREEYVTTYIPYLEATRIEKATQRMNILEKEKKEIATKTTKEDEEESKELEEFRKELQKKKGA